MIADFTRGLKAQDPQITVHRMPDDQMFDKWRLSRKKRPSAAQPSRKRKHRRSESLSSNSSDASEEDQRQSHSRRYSHHSRHHSNHHRDSYSPAPRPAIIDERYDDKISWPSLADYIMDFNKRFSTANRYIDGSLFLDNGIASLIELKKITTPELRAEPFLLNWGDANALEEDIKKTIKNLRSRYAEDC